MRRLGVQLILASAILAGVNGSAQTPARFHPGITAGTRLTHAKMQSQYFLYTEAAPVNLGWMAGMVGQFDIVDNLTVDGSLGVSHDAVHADGYYPDPVEAMYTNYDFTWLENSVSLRYKFLNRNSFSLFSGVGITASHLIKSTMALSFDDSAGVPWDVTTYMNRWNCSLPISAGIEFPLGGKKLSCTFSYNVGLRGVYAPMGYAIVATYPPQEYFEDGMFKLNTASVSFAYMFSGSRKVSGRK